MVALKDALVFAIRAARPDPVTSRDAPSRNVVGVVIRRIEAELKGGGTAHIPNGLPSEPEERTGYTDMLESIKKTLKGS